MHLESITSFLLGEMTMTEYDRLIERDDDEDVWDDEHEFNKDKHENSYEIYFYEGE